MINTVHKQITIRRKIIIAAVVLAVLAVLAVWAFYIGLVVRHYKLKTDKLGTGQTVRVVVIADLHSCWYGEGQRNLIVKIEDAQPDVIALVGDIVDDDRREDAERAFFSGIRGIAPSFYVSGNHEYWSNEIDRIKDMVREYGVTVLENEHETIMVNGVQLCICGIDDPDVLRYSSDPSFRAMESADELLYGFDDLDENTVNVLLAHRPEQFASYQAYDFDLVLSGHSHGGQVRIPIFVNGLFAPNQGYFPKYGGGEYTEDGMTMIVSRGLAINPRLPRIFNPPEMIVVDIVPGQ